MPRVWKRFRFFSHPFPTAKDVSISFVRSKLLEFDEKLNCVWNLEIMDFLGHHKSLTRLWACLMNDYEVVNSYFMNVVGVGLFHTSMRQPKHRKLRSSITGESIIHIH